MSSRACNNCGWIHFGVSREHAEAQVLQFNTYYKALAAQQRQDWYRGRGADIIDYEQCHRCGGSYTRFRDATEAECEAIRGSTISPIIAQ